MASEYYRVCWQSIESPQTFHSEILSSAREAKKYAADIRPFGWLSVWIETAEWKEYPTVRWVNS